MDTCEWVLEDNEYETTWMTSCHNAFSFLGGDPASNEFAYCPYCGRALTQRAPDATPQPPLRGEVWQTDEELPTGV